MHCISRWNANHLSYHLAFASFKLGAVLIKLAGFLAARGPLHTGTRTPAH